MNDWVDVPWRVAFVFWLWFTTSITTILLGILAHYWLTWLVGYIGAVIVAAAACSLSRHIHDRRK